MFAQKALTIFLQSNSVKNKRIVVVVVVVVVVTAVKKERSSNARCIMRFYVTILPKTLVLFSINKLITSNI